MKSQKIAFELIGSELHKARASDGADAPVGIRSSDVERFLARRFNTDVRDLVRVAAAVYETDRLAPRARKGAREADRELAWQRDVVEIDPTVLDAEECFVGRGSARDDVRALLVGVLRRHSKEVLNWFEQATSVVNK